MQRSPQLTIPMNYDQQDDDDNEVSIVSRWLFIIAVVGLGVAVFVLSSCTYGNANHALALGGKGAYKGKTFAMTWDNESSFREAALLGALAVGAWQSAAAD